MTTNFLQHPSSTRLVITFTAALLIIILAQFTPALRALDVSLVAGSLLALIPTTPPGDSLVHNITIQALAIVVFLVWPLLFKRSTTITALWLMLISSLALLCELPWAVCSLGYGITTVIIPFFWLYNVIIFVVRKYVGDRIYIGVVHGFLAYVMLFMLDQSLLYLLNNGEETYFRSAEIFAMIDMGLLLISGLLLVVQAGKTLYKSFKREAKIEKGK